MITDFLYDDTGDIAIKDGDLVAGEVMLQNVIDILESSAGHFKFDPSVGVGLTNYINNDYTEADIVSKIRLGLESDGASIKSLSLDNLSLVIDATYKKSSSNVTTNTVTYTGNFTSYKVQNNQSIFDIALIIYGSVQGAFRMKEINAFTVFPPVLEDGQILQVDSFVNRKGLYSNINENLATK